MQYDPIKDTPQWKALNSIWKSCSKEQQELLMKDFKVLGEFIRKHTHIDKKCLNKNQNNRVKIENEPLVREIIDLCWERTHSSKQSQNIDNEE